MSTDDNLISRNFIFVINFFIFIINILKNKRLEYGIGIDHLVLKIKTVKANLKSKARLSYYKCSKSSIIYYNIYLFLNWTWHLSTLSMQKYSTILLLSINLLLLKSPSKVFSLSLMILNGNLFMLDQQMINLKIRY